MQYQMLDWDTEFFKLPVARITHPGLSTPELFEILSDLKRNGAKLIYWPAVKECAEEVLKEYSGMLVDRKTTFAIDFGTLDMQSLDSSTSVEPYAASMPVEDLEKLAVQSGENSRFAADSRIPREKFIALYKAWMNASLRKELAMEVLVIREDGRVAGMVTLGEKNGRGDMGLLAVDRDFRGKKYGERLVRAAQHWFVRHGYASGQVVTQGLNVSACNLYRKCGYSVEKVEYFYHFWV